jgi:murein DD-endopeptidase MepM/ murein hydrolase activator NlpD
LRARLILILVPILTAFVLVVSPTTVAEARSTPGTATATASGWLSRSTAGLQQPAQLVERMRDAERARVLAVVKILTAPPPPVTDPTSFIWPAKAPITSGFGRRGGRPHEGVDIDAPYGAPIVAAQTGTVTFAGVKNGYGNTTIIDHGHGISTLYAHQSKILVRVGQHVSQGDLIGKVGATGHVTAPHLHYEVHVNGAPRNPMPWL